MNKVLIAAAGRGTRLRDWSQDRPKHMIEIAGHPFLYYLLNNLKQAGFDEVIMVVGYKKEKIEAFLRTYQGQFKITILNQFEMLGEEKYGTACPLICARDLLAGQNFLSVYGDNLYAAEDLQNFNANQGHHYVAGLVHDQPQLYGVLQLDKNGFLENILEKPSHPPSNLINTGLYKFTPEVFNHLDHISLSPRGEYELTDVINILANKKRVKVLPLQGQWLDLGRPEDIAKVAAYVQNHYD